MASSKKSLDKPVTQKQILEVMEMIKELGTMLLQKIEREVGGLQKEISGVQKEVGSLQKEVGGVRKEGRSLRIEFESFRGEQRDSNKELAQKVDENTSAIQALDKRVRYQKDMPERLDHVEHKQYELERRVNAIEKSK